MTGTVDRLANANARRDFLDVGYQASRRRDPQLKAGDTMDKFKARVLEVVATVVQNGLISCGQNEVLSIDLRSTEAGAALDDLSENDIDMMYHSNDGLIQAMSIFITDYGNARMLPLRGESLEGRSARCLLAVARSLDLMYKRGLSVDIKPSGSSQKIGRGVDSVSRHPS